jgi:hypothetical protein
MTHISILIDKVHEYRQTTFRLPNKTRIHTLDDALGYINSRGLISFWPLKGITLPSLWTATAGDRPVPNAHDDPGHITWSWKDELLGQNLCYYARILCKRNFFVSLELLPNLYSLSKNFGDPGEDHKILYESGEMSNTAYKIYNAILNNGPLDTLSIKQIVHLFNKEGDILFNKAIDELQNEFKILPVGISRSGGWRYAFIYNISSNQFPDLIEKTRFITETRARKALLINYLKSVGAATFNEITKLFKWKRNLLTESLDELINNNQIVYGTMVDKGNELLYYGLIEMISG